MKAQVTLSEAAKRKLSSLLVVDKYIVDGYGSNYPITQVRMTELEYICWKGMKEKVSKHVLRKMALIAQVTNAVIILEDLEDFRIINLNEYASERAGNNNERM